MPGRSVRHKASFFVINGFQRSAIVFDAGNVVLGGFCAAVGGGEFSDFFACGGVGHLLPDAKDAIVASRPFY